jgi:23S rRNA (guanosine2251-2'-O)-methyltransferase
VSGESVSGFHAIAEALKSGSRGTLWLCGRKSRNLELETLARFAGIRVVWTSAEELDRMARGADHRGAILATAPEASRPKDLERELHTLGGEAALVVVLDHLDDPHNVGAILRSADQFGVDLVLMPQRRSAGVTPVVARVSAGASAHVPTVVVGNVAAALRTLKEAGFWIYGAHMDGRPLDQLRFAPRAALVMGSEGRGLAALTARLCDELVSIPRARGAHVDSLNVSVAAGILMSEIRRTQARPSSRTP